MGTQATEIGASGLRRFLKRVNGWLDSRTGQIGVLVIIALVYLKAYWIYPARPGLNSQFPLGWLGWWDQGQYWKCAASLAHGSLTPETYWYPLGYPALGALFYRWMPQHAFLIPNLLLVAGIAMLFYRIAIRFITPIESALLLAVFTLCYLGTTSISLVEPWNTIPTTFLTYGVILLIGLHRPNGKAVILAAITIGLAYLCRPPDALCLGLILAVAILSLPGWTEKIKFGLASVGILLLFVGTVTLINRAVFGSWRSNYEISSAGIGFGSFPIAEKAFMLLIDGTPLFGERETAVLTHFPWLLVVPPGAVYFVRKFGWSAVAVLSSILGTFVLYFAYNDFWPANIFHYHLIHYLFWTFPLFALLAYVTVRDAWKDRIGRYSFALILPLLATACFLTWKVSVSGRIAAPLVANSTIPPVGDSEVDWILFRGGVIKQDPFRRDLNLTPFRDFKAFERNDGHLLYLATRTRLHPVANLETLDWRTILYGKLKWAARWPPRPFDQSTWFAAADITLRRTSDHIDVTGPTGIADGRFDEVIEVRMDKESAPLVASWDIETTDRRGHWVSNENVNGWWLIKVDSLPTGESKRACFRLVFPDYGDFDRAQAFTLRASDIEGNVVVSKTIRK